MNNDVIFENYGIVKSDFIHFGALPTKSFKSLEAEIESGDKIVIGGGEVLFVNWTILYSFINPWFRFLLNFKKLRKLENRIKFSQRLLSSKRIVFPFSFNASDFRLSELNIYYSSVGGGNLLLRDNIKQRLAKNRMQSAQIISVRDYRSLNYFLRHQEMEAKLIPDTALLMSDFFPITKLRKEIGGNLKFDNYIFLQLGANKGPENLVEFSNHLLKISKDLKCDVILCPIGLAPGHEDHKILRKLKKMKPEFDFVMPKNIFEIMYLIGNSNLYIGTSLHGAITAMSFLVPAIGLNKKIDKVESYMKTWVSEDYENLDFFDVRSNEINRLTNLFKTNFNLEKLEKQKLLVYSNLKAIIND